MILECGCGFKARGTEYEAEVKMSQHECPATKRLEELPFKLLREVAYGRLTEEEAWAIANA